jgi:subtilisin family serine protease
MGNEATDLGYPTSDPTSPDYPPGAAYDRTVDNSCLTVPTETRGVIAVTSTARSLRKAYYSNYGPEQADIAAPGGDAYDTASGDRDISGLVLAAYPEKLALETGAITEPGGVPTVPTVIRDCRQGTCAYYQYLQGTSMASPHAAGVAALIVSRYGRKDGRHAGLTLAPGQVQKILYATASQQACPTPPDYTYTLKRPTGTETFTHTCAGTPEHNGFYGHGIVNAGAVAAGRR